MHFRVKYVLINRFSVWRRPLPNQWFEIINKSFFILDRWIIPNHKYVHICHKVCILDFKTNYQCFGIMLMAVAVKEIFKRYLKFFYPRIDKCLSCPKLKNKIQLEFQLEIGDILKLSFGSFYLGQARVCLPNCLQLCQPTL